MPELTLHDVDSTLLQRLKELASQSGRSVEQEAKVLLAQSVGLLRTRCADAARRLRESHGRTFSDSAELIREDRQR